MYFFVQIFYLVHLDIFRLCLDNSKCFISLIFPSYFSYFFLILYLFFLKKFCVSSILISFLFNFRDLEQDGILGK